jgi:ABC-type glycerol-3-phosphate transport system permease component
VFRGGVAIDTESKRLSPRFQSVPLELEEAARIALPLAAPGLAATAIFTLLNAWDEFFFALIFSSPIAPKRSLSPWRSLLAAIM